MNAVHDPIPFFIWFPCAVTDIPVFTLHGVDPDSFELLLIFLKENHYRTLRADEYLSYRTAGKTKTSERLAVLTFDDARLTEWIFGYPLLKKYGFSCINFVVVSKIEERSNLTENLSTEEKSILLSNRDLAENWWSRCMSWKELEEGEKAGVFDIQSHTMIHEIVFAGDQVADFQRPGIGGSPLYVEFGRDEILKPVWGTPLFKREWKPAVDAEFIPSEKFIKQCIEFAEEHGGERFVSDPSSLKQMHAFVKRLNIPRGEWKPILHRPEYLIHELTASKEIIEKRLNKKVLHFSPPVHSYNQNVVNEAAKAGYRCFYDGRGGRSSKDIFIIKRYGGHWLFYLRGKNSKNVYKRLFSKLIQK